MLCQLVMPTICSLLEFCSSSTHTTVTQTAWTTGFENSASYFIKKPAVLCLHTLTTTTQTNVYNGCTVITCQGTGNFWPSLNTYDDQAVKDGWLCIPGSFNPFIQCLVLIKAAALESQRPVVPGMGLNNVNLHKHHLVTVVLKQVA